MEYVEDLGGRRLGAVVIDNIRLIDNVAIEDSIKTLGLDRLLQGLQPDFEMGQRWTRSTDGSFRGSVEVCGPINFGRAYG